MPLVREEFKSKTGVDLDNVRMITPDQYEIYNELLESRKSTFEETMSSGGLPVDIPDEVGAWSPRDVTIPRMQGPSQPVDTGAPVSIVQTYIINNVENNRQALGPTDG